MEHLNKYLEKVQTYLGWFTVGFVRVKAQSINDRLLGSGTLVVSA
jgi:hypothetical protein